MATKSAAAKAVQEKPEQEAPKFSVEQLRKHCVRLFGISSSTFDGAMYGKKEPMTIEEAKAIIKGWLGKEAK
jgi:hypothetical protein